MGKGVDEELFYARPPFRGRSVVVQGKEVLTLLPLLNVGALRAPIRPSDPLIPAYWQPHFIPQLGVTSPCSGDAGFQIHHNPALPTSKGVAPWPLAPWSRVREQGQARKLMMGHSILLTLLFCCIINAWHCINLHKLSLYVHPTCL